MGCLDSRLDEYINSVNMVAKNGGFYLASDVFDMLEQLRDDAESDRLVLIKKFEEVGKTKFSSLSKPLIEVNDVIKILKSF